MPNEVLPVGPNDHSPRRKATLASPFPSNAHAGVRPCDCRYRRQATRLPGSYRALPAGTSHTAIHSTMAWEPGMGSKSVTPERAPRIDDPQSRDNTGIPLCPSLVGELSAHHPTRQRTVRQPRPPLHPLEQGWIGRRGVGATKDVISLVTRALVQSDVPEGRYEVCPGRTWDGFFGWAAIWCCLFGTGSKRVGANSGR